MKRRSVSLTKADRDPRGGLSPSGRAKYRAAGAHLRPGVKTVRTVADARRKGSFLRRMYARETLPPLQTATGEPTRYALQAAAWGERPPRTVADARALARHGEQLLERARDENPRRAPTLTRTAPPFEPLQAGGRYRAELRARVLGLPAAVYVLRKIGQERPEYVGSSLPGQNDSQAESQPRRVWKTILRHFHAPHTRGRSKKTGKRAYSFARDNWVAPDPEHYEIAILACDPQNVRELEIQAQDALKPRHLPPDYQPPEERAAQRRAETESDDDVPF